MGFMFGYKAMGQLLMLVHLPQTRAMLEEIMIMFLVFIIHMELCAAAR